MKAKEFKDTIKNFHTSLLTEERKECCDPCCCKSNLTIEHKEDFSGGIVINIDLS